MLFSSMTFLFVFMPLVMSVYFLAKKEKFFFLVSPPDAAEIFIENADFQDFTKISIS